MNALQSLVKRFARSRPRPRRAHSPIDARQARFEQLEDRVVLDGVSFLFPEFSIQVNPDSMGINRQPTVDIAPDGDFIVAWRNNSEHHMYSRAYRSNMSPKQAEPVNLTAEDVHEVPDLWNDLSPDVATNDSGESVVVWNGPFEFSSYHHAMFFQQTGPNGTPDPAQPGKVYEDVYAFFEDNKVAMADSGDFVVAWTEVEPDPEVAPLFDSDVYCRFFHEDGTPYGSDPPDDPSDDPYYYDPSDVASDDLYEIVDGVAVDSVHHISVVVWRESPVDSADNYEIYFRMYDFSGGEVEELVEPTLVGNGIDASVAMDQDGNFLIAWLHEGDIYAQRFTDQGATIGSSVLLVDSEPNLFNSEANLDVSICGSQGVVGYEQYTGDYPYYDSFIQQFHFGGGAITLGVQRSLGATANGADTGPSVAMNESGEFVVAYIRDYDDSVRARKFHPDGSSVWPSTIYMVPDAELLPPGFWSTVDAVQIDVGNLEAINATPLIGPIDGLDTAGRGPSPILSDVSMQPASGHTDTVSLRRTDGTIVSTRHDPNDEALLAVINEQNGLLSDIFDDLDKFEGFMTAANRCSLQM